ncbi:porin family protein [Dysgonomonas macrotermitis]|uniref:Outer membrane protein beta-barrel domain-containing protein n=1 Tax=Dysgonomonas macrotermitis TaxID=1346286 RepID=A0A1M5CYL1_9BACT|nr:porin family protein [Dysgonomonas macrotermitis]SHF59800.1 Outer membrane protein beta-barrel domain-containing protein [Dysgonomonas macrotermitis]
MRISTLIIFLGIGACTLSSVQAQEKESPWTFGVKAGINLSDSEMGASETKTGFTGGVTVEYALKDNFFLSSGLEFKTKHSSIGESSFYTAESGNLEATRYYNNRITSSRLSYLQLPIAVGYRLPLSPKFNLTFKTGVYVAYGLGASVREETYAQYSSDGPISNNNINYEYSVNKYSGTDVFGGVERFDYGLLAGAGVEYKRISLNVDWEMGLRSYGSNSSYGAADLISRGYGWKNRNITLSAGYRF